MDRSQLEGKKRSVTGQAKGWLVFCPTEWLMVGGGK